MCGRLVGVEVGGERGFVDDFVEELLLDGFDVVEEGGGVGVFGGGGGRGGAGELVEFGGFFGIVGGEFVGGLGVFGFVGFGGGEGEVDLGRLVAGVVEGGFRVGGLIGEDFLEFFDAFVNVGHEVLGKKVATGGEGVFEVGS